MTDWARKHLLDLASACAEAQAAPELSVDQKKALSEACALVKQLSSLPDGGGGKTVTTAVRHVCETCRNALLHPCPGRTDWSVPCLLVHAYVSTDDPFSPPYAPKPKISV